MESQKYNPVAWFEIYVNDMDRASRFYEAVLNITLNDMSNPTETEMQMKGFPGSSEGMGATGSLVKMDRMPGGGSGTIIYFGSNDCSVEESRVEAAGGKVVQPKMSIGEYGFISLAQDTEGNMIGLYSMQ
ncbi:MAG TPA: VOC family protein [Flavipsychrobacter sp.]|nr:VOC family protein [Flavipsychrobacter sp.]